MINYFNFILSFVTIYRDVSFFSNNKIFEVIFNMKHQKYDIFTK